MEDRCVLGRALYELGLRLGSLGSVAIGCAGGALAQALARSLGCGVALGGGRAWFHDGSCAACGVWLGRYYALPATVFLRQRGAEVTTLVLDGSGCPLTPPDTRPTEGCTGSWELLAGADCGWAARRAVGGCGGLVAAEGPPALALLLERLGCDVLDRPRPGVPLLRSDPEGFRLTVEWEGRCVTPAGEDALSAAAHWLAGNPAVRKTVG